jgi:hypothetical protein
MTRAKIPVLRRPVAAQADNFHSLSDNVPARGRPGYGKICLPLCP